MTDMERYVPGLAQAFDTLKRRIAAWEPRPCPDDWYPHDDD